MVASARAEAAHQIRLTRVHMKVHMKLTTTALRSADLTTRPCTNYWVLANLYTNVSIMFSIPIADRSASMLDLRSARNSFPRVGRQVACGVSAAAQSPESGQCACVRGVRRRA
jgi:hypothetical protein